MGENIIMVQEEPIKEFLQRKKIHQSKKNGTILKVMNRKQ